MFFVWIGLSLFWVGPGHVDATAAARSFKDGNEATCLMLRDGRFQATLEWRGASDEALRSAQSVSLREETGFDETGYFFFGDPDNIDVTVRVFDGCQFNDHFWVFYAGLTKVEFELTVTDTQEGISKTYTNPLGQPAPPIQDTQAFATCPAPRPTPPRRTKATSEETLSLFEDRFLVDIDYDVRNGQAGKATVGVQTGTSGAFWFLDRSDFNVYLKITDGRAVNGHFWLTYTSFTGAEYTMRVTDTQSGLVKTYHNPFGETTFGTDVYLDDPNGGLLYPWISDNDSFDSMFIANNNNCIDTDITLEATRGNGETATTTRTIPANGFLEEASSDLFPELSGGSGYSVLLTSPSAGLDGRWITNNLNTPSGNSPSQGVAVRLPTQIANPLPPNAAVGQSLQYGLLPLRDDFFAGIVVVNVGDAPTDVALYFYSKDGRLILRDEDTLSQLPPFQPFAAVSRDLVPGRTESVSMIAHSPDQPLSGVTFFFNQNGEPAIGNVTALDFIPPPQ